VRPNEVTTLVRSNQIIIVCVSF